MCNVIYILLLTMLIAFPTTGAGTDDCITTLFSERSRLSSEEGPRSTVVRDGASYEKLREAHPKLPKAETIDFEKNSVVAVYLDLPSPCHSLSYRKTEGRLHVTVKGPPKDVMCAQVIESIAEVKLVPAPKSKKIEVVFAR